MAISALHAVPILRAICLQKQLRYITRKKNSHQTCFDGFLLEKKYNSTIEYCLHVQSKLSRYISPHFERNAFNSFFSNQKNKFQGTKIWSRNSLEIQISPFGKDVKILRSSFKGNLSSLRLGIFPVNIENVPVIILVKVRVNILNLPFIKKNRPWTRKIAREPEK